MNDRGQSEVLGVVLVTAIVLLLIAVMTPAVLEQFQVADQRVHIDGAATTSDVVIDNYGGDALAFGELTAIVRIGGERAELDVTAAGVPGENGDGKFGVGERWKRNHGLTAEVGEDVTVFLIHDDHGSVGKWEGAVRGELPPPPTVSPPPTTTAPGTTTAPTSTTTGPTTTTSGPTTTTAPTTTTSGPNQPPSAQFTVSTRGANYDLDGTASSDPDGSIVNYQWDIGNDGSFETQYDGQPTISFKPNGETDVRLVVTDDDGATDAYVDTVGGGGGPPGRGN